MSDYHLAQSRGAITWHLASDSKCVSIGKAGSIELRTVLHGHTKAEDIGAKNTKLKALSREQRLALVETILLSSGNAADHGVDSDSIAARKDAQKVEKDGSQVAAVRIGKIWSIG